VDRQGPDTRSQRPQCGILRRQGARPLALRDRHVGPHGAALSPGKARRRQFFIHESIIGSLFKGRIEGRTKVDGIDAIIPSIEGWAHITGINTIFLDDRDPCVKGFQVN